MAFCIWIRIWIHMLEVSSWLYDEVGILCFVFALHTRDAPSYHSKNNKNINNWKKMMEKSKWNKMSAAIKSSGKKSDERRNVGTRGWRYIFLLRLLEFTILMHSTHSTGSLKWCCCYAIDYLNICCCHRLKIGREKNEHASNARKTRWINKPKKKKIRGKFSFFYTSMIPSSLKLQSYVVVIGNAFDSHMCHLTNEKPRYVGIHLVCVLAMGDCKRLTIFFFDRLYHYNNIFGDENFKIAENQQYENDVIEKSCWKYPRVQT